MAKFLLPLSFGLLFFLTSFHPMVATILPAATYDLRIEVSNIANNKGLIEFALYKNPDVFTQAGKTHRLYRLDAQKGTVSHTFKDLEAGKYAIVVYHDENHNKICDKNFFGIPTEAYAFSNNMRPKLSAPSFEECAIKLQQDRSIDIKMVY
ncbi:MAG: hypothetical protein RL440_233 [Bacteroidota bacterium]|jgi:uncharacterized protein (DUF2141 family)